MSLRTWLFGEPREREAFRRAMALADEVTLLMRDRAVRRDPLKVMLVDLLFHNHDPALVADAFEMSQEARIYKGTTH